MNDNASLALGASPSGFGGLPQRLVQDGVVVGNNNADTMVRRRLRHKMLDAIQSPILCLHLGVPGPFAFCGIVRLPISSSSLAVEFLLDH